MKKLVKILSVFVKLGERAASLFGKVVDAADRLLHYKEYRRQKRVAAVFRTMLCVACGVLAVVFFPYRVRVEKNGDFEIRSLMLRIYRKAYWKCVSARILCLSGGFRPQQSSIARRCPS